jgi:large subunit ribosomal protein L4
MELQVLNAQGEATATVPAPATVFGREFNEALVHQLVIAYQANARQGTRAQKDRAMVKHSTKKPWRQKGTGRVCSIFSKLASDGRIAVIDGLSIDAPKTKLLASKLKAMGLDSALVITEAMDENLLLASRNLKNVLVVEPRYADPLSLIHYKRVIVTKGAIAKIEEMWG